MIRVTIKPSRLLATAFAAVHLCAAATLLPLDVSTELKLAAAALIAASLCRTIWRHALLRCSRSITAVQILDQETGALRCRDDAWHEARLLGTTYVTPRLTVINLKRSGARLAEHVLLTADNVDAEDFRKIRVLLRWAKPKRSEEDTAEPDLDPSTR